jgi:hypothetical protein
LAVATVAFEPVGLAVADLVAVVECFAAELLAAELLVPEFDPEELEPQAATVNETVVIAASDTIVERRRRAPREI